MISLVVALLGAAAVYGTDVFFCVVGRTALTRVSDSALVETMGPRALSAYAQLCGWTLARAHARSGDAAAIASYLGAGDTFDQALADFAEAYADQNEHDYNALRHAVDTGRVTAHADL